MNLANTSFMLNHAASEKQSLRSNPRGQSAGMERRASKQAGRRLPRMARFLPLLLLLGLCRATPAGAQQPTNAQTQLAAVQAEMSAAIQQVQRIVNQPVARYALAAGMSVATYKPGWFHEGATKPDFNTVDVRATQETIYDQHDYVTSDLNPGVVFVGRQLEFNAMTKYLLPGPLGAQEEALPGGNGGDQPSLSHHRPLRTAVGPFAEPRTRSGG